MERLLRNTHKKEYIDLLKVRDYYFEKALKWNNITRFFTLLPPIIVALTYLPFIPYYKFIDEERDILVGAISIFSFIVIQFLCKKKIEDNMDISNAIREIYDCKVFGIPENPFLSEKLDLSLYIRKALTKNYYYKYRIWYEEMFCKTHTRNVICSQLDNIVYTYHVYREFKIYIYVIFAVLLLSSLISLSFGIKVLVLVLISFFNIIQYLLESLSTTDALIKKNKKLMQATKDNKDEILKELDENDTDFLRMLQDVVFSNREESIFIPRFLRYKYLREDSAFYKELNEYKAIYLDKATVYVPSCADDIDIFNMEETETVTLKKIQDRLLEMMTDVSKVFQENGILYTLDGGTLIGAVRDESSEQPRNVVVKKGGGFVFWDDDIDLAIPTTGGMLEKAQNVIKECLGDKYDIQDYDSDPYYSPRLSNFRIRDKRSFISEKDSCLYELYNSRGLFIDVYAYTPILYNRFIDSCFRRMVIHPIYKSIKKIEDAYLPLSRPTNADERKALDNHLQSFLNKKKKYMKTVNWYLRHAKCDSYFVCTPNYIDNLKKAGPYIKKEDLYEHIDYAQFETLTLPIPANADRVLSTYYGKWYESPFKSKEELQAKYGEEQWFNKEYFVITVMKHIDHVNIQ